MTTNFRYLSILLASFFGSMILVAPCKAQSSAAPVNGKKYVCATTYGGLLCPQGFQEYLYPKSMQTRYRWAKVYREEVTFPKFFSTTQAAQAFNATRDLKSNFLRHVTYGSANGCGTDPALNRRGIINEAYRDTPPPGLTPEQLQKIKDADDKLWLEFNSYKQHAQQDCNETLVGRPRTFGPFKIRITHGGEAIYDPVKKKFVDSKGLGTNFSVEGEYAHATPAMGSGESPFGYRHLFQADETTGDLKYIHERHFIMQCCISSSGEDVY